jgi:hypothetical protein
MCAAGSVFAARDTPISGWTAKDVPPRPPGASPFRRLLNPGAYPARKRDPPSIVVALPVNS